MELGKHHIALAVKDIKVSKDFYETLGFTVIPKYGSIAEKWLIMHNGESKIGLYQDMFPKNMLTFNPSNARIIYAALKEKGVKIEMEANIKKEYGPCHFAFFDPDGNPILVDQFEEGSNL